MLQVIFIAFWTSFLIISYTYVGYPIVIFYHQPERKGKIHAVNRIMPFVRSPITVFSDANSVLNTMALKNIVRHYQDASVGGVGGEKRIVKKNKDTTAGTGEGLYWRYE